MKVINAKAVDSKEKNNEAVKDGFVVSDKRVQQIRQQFINRYGYL